MAQRVFISEPTEDNCYYGHIRCICKNKVYTYKGNKRLLCNKCHRRWELIPTKVNHQFSVNSTDHVYRSTYFVCPVCGKLADKLHDLNHHALSYVCDDCMLSQLDKLIQVRETCNEIIPKINKLRLIDEI